MNLRASCSKLKNLHVPWLGWLGRPAPLLIEWIVAKFRLVIPPTEKMKRCECEVSRFTSTHPLFQQREPSTMEGMAKTSSIHSSSPTRGTKKRSLMARHCIFFVSLVCLTLPSLLGTLLVTTSDAHNTIRMAASMDLPAFAAAAEDSNDEDFPPFDYHAWETKDGTYRFTDTAACCDFSCQIHFPVPHDDPRPCLDSCLRTEQGTKVTNQDRGLLLDSLALRPEDGEDSTSKLLVLLDGHFSDGHDLADTILKDLPSRLVNNIMSPINRNKGMDVIINTTFLETDQAVSEIHPVTAGSTAIVALKIGHHLYIASTGDSTAFLAQWKDGQAHILESAAKHKPDHEEEAKRIKQAGGTVFKSRPESTSARAGWTDRDTEDNWNTAMSRSLGNKSAKDVGVHIAVPTIKKVNLKDYGPHASLFLVATSDGITDRLSARHVAKELGRTLYGDSNVSLSRMTKSIVNTAALLWDEIYKGRKRDDLTVLVTKIGP